nr:hypothetical protein [Tanacetum cinerariifolium]
AAGLARVARGAAAAERAGLELAAEAHVARELAGETLGRRVGRLLAEHRLVLERPASRSGRVSKGFERLSTSEEERATD